jgi:cytoskeletal protein CcmA (bactofilin family)
MSDAQTTVIGASIVIIGNIVGEDDDLIIRGRVEGTIQVGGTVTIEEHGIVKADIDASELVVHGILVGNIESAERVEIGSTGRMVGNLKTERLVIQPGARVRGEVDMGDAKVIHAQIPQKKTETLDASTTALARAALPRLGSRLPERRTSPVATVAKRAPVNIKDAAKAKAKATAAPVAVAEPAKKAAGRRRRG